ncbi:hypothetical protein PSU4_50200 [Pseudonocardia sulfidoxydans NBRC 16205]|uniref:Uncharacterized protein n=1 Tax=Pseudonocardia sulfidoxydans NBRC 16205 TaxID=1223511 RepID=A0A511DMM4_9PSEU|nr:hypothetical protein [Pseudonocardia sulfidoxydans]GEL26066.1 hypothetical protein PSU4_50200 [Pseudonocardia sulfidoxydans NBRC 16205]
MTNEVHRKTVPLTQNELDALASARTAGTALHKALTDYAGLTAARSVASTLHAIFALGLAELDRRALAHGYDELAAEDDVERHAYIASVRSRRRDYLDES